MTRQPYRQSPPGPGYSRQEEEYYDPRRRPGTSPSTISAIILGVIALLMMILMMVNWSMGASTTAEAREQERINSELRKESDRLRKGAREKKAQLTELNNAMRSKLGKYYYKQVVAAAKQGTGTYWKAKYEDARERARGWEMEANSSKAKVEALQKLRPIGPAAPEGTGPPPPPPAP